MAGIGFQLHKLIEDKSFLNKAKAYIFASIITSGPWILSVVCLALLGLLSTLFITSESFIIISITILYSFAFSIIITGPIQFVLTRYLADKEYLKQKEKMLSALFTALALTLFVSLAFAVPWYILNEGSWGLKIISISLFVIISSIWTMLDFLSCLKHYQSIVTAFLIGNGASVALLLLIGNFLQLEGALLGYTLGQLCILLLIIFTALREFPLKGLFNRELLTYFGGFPYIFLTGIFYNLGLWIDKLLGWFILGEKVYGNFTAFNYYDTPVFIAYLCIIPSLAYFIIQSETKFYLVHRRFFDSITHETLQKIVQYKNELIALLKKSVIKLFIVQFTTCLIGFILSDFIGAFFNLNPMSIDILRILFFAAGCQVAFLYIIIFLMYFDLSNISFFLVLTFFCLNFGFNILWINFPIFVYGLGYLLAIGITLIISVIVLFFSVSDIEYNIFLRQEN